MKNISLKSEFNSVEFLTAQKVLWEFNQLATWQNIRVYFAYFLGSTILGGIVWYWDREFNPFLVISIFLVFLIVVWVWEVNKKKKRYFRALEEVANKYKALNFQYSFEFTDKQLMYYDSEKTINLDWVIINGYVEFKGYIILKGLGGAINHLFKIEEENPEYQQIKEFIDQKLVQRVL